MNGGTCSGDGTCDCEEGYEGNTCQYKKCPKPCLYGTCNGTLGECMCDDGYALIDGVCNCSTAACPNDCSSHGTCVCGACQCDEGWSGDHCSCSTDNCVDLNGCSGRGVCTCNVCTCESGYLGDDCGCVECPKHLNLPCGGHGDCHCNGTCSCEDEYLGESCDYHCILDACGVCNGDSLSVRV